MNPERAASPTESRPFTLSLTGLDPSHFRPLTPTLVGSRVRLIVDFDPVTLEAKMRTDPDGVLSPGQVLTILQGMMANVSQVVLENERAFQALSTSLNNGAK